MLKILLIVLFSTFGYAKTYTFSTGDATALDFGTTISNTTVVVPNPVNTILCKTLRDTLGTLKLRVNSSGVGSYTTYSVSWTLPPTLVNGANSIPVTIIIGFCDKNGAGNVDGGTVGLTPPHIFQPAFDNQATRYWYFGRGTAVVPMGTPAGVYTGTIVFTGTY